MCHCGICIYNPKPTKMPLRGDNKPTLLKKSHNPTGELLQYMWRRYSAYQRYKRMYPKSRYDIGAI